MENKRRLLVPIIKDIPSERAVELGCHLAHDTHAELILVHVIVVPYALSLDAPLPTEEVVARDNIEQACAIAVQFGCEPQTIVLRHRSAAEGILHLARQEQVDAIILGADVKERVPGEWGKTCMEILHHAECEVIVDKAPQVSEPLTVGT